MKVEVMKALLITAVALLIALPSAALAQGKTDFSGSWKFDEAKSDPRPLEAAVAGAVVADEAAAAWVVHRPQR